MTRGKKGPVKKQRPQYRYFQGMSYWNVKVELASSQEKLRVQFFMGLYANSLYICIFCCLNLCNLPHVELMYLASTFVSS